MKIKIKKVCKRAKPELNPMLVHHRATSSIMIAGIHFYTWVERDTVRVVSCPRTQHNVPGPYAYVERNLSVVLLTSSSANQKLKTFEVI